MLILSVVQQQLDAHSPRREHIDECIDAEEPDLPSNEVTHPRLRDAEQRGCLPLAEACLLDQLAQCSRELYPQL